MEEQTNIDGTKTEGKALIPVADPIADPKEGSEPTSTPFIDKAIEERKRMEATAERMEAAATRLEALDVRRALGGSSEAGRAPVKEKRKTDEEYADAYERGEVDPFKEDGL